MKNIPKFHYIVSPILWLSFLVLRSVAILLGYVLVPIAAIFKAHEMRESKIYKGREIRAFTWPFMWPWGNEEEGVGYYGEGSLVQRIIYSECIRNPANNLRYVPILSLKIDPSKVQFWGNKDWEDLDLYDQDSQDFTYFAWQGAYSCIRWQGTFLGTRRRFWLGWKIYPGDKNGLPSWDHRNASAGFATQFRRLK